MRCFISFKFCQILDLSLNAYSYLDLFLHGRSSSFDNHQRYQQRNHKLLGRKCASFIWCLKACMNLNGTERLVKMDWKNFESLKLKSLLVLFLKCGKKIHAEEQHFQKRYRLQSFCRYIHKYAFLCDAIDLKQSVESSLKVLGKSQKTVLDEVNLYSSSLPRSPRQPFLSQCKLIAPSLAEQFLKVPLPLYKSTIVLVCIFSSNFGHSKANQKNSIIKR